MKERKREENWGKNWYRIVEIEKWDLNRYTTEIRDRNEEAAMKEGWKRKKNSRRGGGWM